MQSIPPWKALNSDCLKSEDQEHSSTTYVVIVFHLKFLFCLAGNIINGQDIKSDVETHRPN